MAAPRIVLISISAVVGLAACGDNAGRVLGTISLDPGNPKLAAGITLDVKASYVAADQTTSEAADATWAVDDATVATVMPGTGGRATLLGVNAGTTTLSVAGNGARGAFTVTVAPAVLTGISITPPDPSLAAGTSLQLTATAVFSDKTSLNVTKLVTWKSSATATASVESDGLLHGAVAGAVSVSATLAKITAISNIRVTSATLSSIGVTPLDPRLPLGIHQQFTATGVFSDDSTQDLTGQVTWGSDTEANATVDAGGMVTAVALGNATIKATRTGISGTSRATVTAAALTSVAIEPPSPSAAAGRTRELTALGTFTDGQVKDLTSQAVWASDTPAIATVDNDTAKGLVGAVATGSAQISATVNRITGSATFTVTEAVLVSIQVTPITPSITAGTTQQFIARGTFSDTSTQDLTTQVLWESSDPDIADISNADPTRGLASGKARGAVTITATFDGTPGSTSLTVTPAALDSITVTPADSTLAQGLQRQFIATGHLGGGTEDLTTQATWTSETTAVAEIDDAAAKGLATAIDLGTTTIRATFGTVTGSTSLTVSAAELVSIDVTPETTDQVVGAMLQYTATGNYTDRSTQDLTTQVVWASDNTTVAQIDDVTGRAHAGAVGTAAISATFTTTAGSIVGHATFHVIAAAGPAR